MLSANAIGSLISIDLKRVAMTAFSEDLGVKEYITQQSKEKEVEISQRFTNGQQFICMRTIRKRVRMELQYPLGVKRVGFERCVRETVASCVSR